MNHHLGWVRDLPDHRDFVLGAAPPPEQPLPSYVDLSPQFPPVYDQGQTNTCVWQAAAACMAYEATRQGETFIDPSRLYGYWYSRAMEGSTGYDGGTQIRDAIKVLASRGICHESIWPFDLSKIEQAPPPECDPDASLHLIDRYARVSQGEHSIKTILAAGNPVLLGIAVFASLESEEVMATGVMPMPGPNESPRGGHGVAIVGLDDTARLFKFRNSWGPDFGVQGYGFLPYAFVTSPDFCSDLWVINHEL